MDYKNVSKNEAKMLSKIRENELLVFGVSELEVLTGWKKTKINNLIYSLTEKKIIKRLKRNNFVLSDNLPSRSYEIATEITSPSYISFWTSLSYYGLTEQQISSIQLVSTNQFREMELGSSKVEVTTFASDRFYGYTKKKFPIAEREKALIDSLYRLDKSGGFDEFVKCFCNAWNRLNKRKFTEYLIRFGNRSMVSRAGYLIEKLGLDFGMFDILERNKSQTYVKLNPNRPKQKNYDNRWKIIINQKKLSCGI